MDKKELLEKISDALASEVDLLARTKDSTARIVLEERMEKVRTFADAYRAVDGH